MAKSTNDACVDILHWMTDWQAEIDSHPGAMMPLDEVEDYITQVTAAVLEALPKDQHLVLRKQYGDRTF